ncbi:MAG TPA: hypothetical protein VH297_07245 [Gaiellaceae bacterium]
MRGLRPAALLAVALAAAGCSSSTPERHAALPQAGPPGVVRVGLADLLWPLEPQRARTRDQIVVARMLFATPLRTDAAGALRPGLCSSWRATGTTWRLRCRHAGAIAAQLRRTKLLDARSVEAPDERTLVVALRNRDPDLPYRLTEVAAAPPGVPGPFRLISASPTRIVAERNGVKLDLRKLEPFEAVRLFRAGRLDEAPVPLGDIRAEQLDPALSPAVRVRRLLAADAVVFRRQLPESVRSVYDDSADRADYQALVPEFQAPPAENLTDRGQPSASHAAIALREARKRIPSLRRLAIRFAEPADPTLAYGTNLLVAAWRDLGLGAVVGGSDARLERLAAPYPRARALPALAGGKQIVPIAWVADARLVSPRLRGWSEDELGSVDYSRVRLRGPSRRR